jgi:hypothetical protein
VFDSGSLSSEATASLFWDSQNNHWIYQRESGSTYDGGMLISGPRNAAGLGNEQGTTACMLLVGQGGDHLTSSLVYHDSTRTCFYPGTLIVSSSCQFIFGNAPADFTFNVGTTCVGTNATVAQFYNNDYTAGTRGFIRVRNGANISATTSAFFGQSQDQKTYFYNNDTSRLGDIVITNTGKVGIGTASPIAQLHIKTDVASASRPTTLATSATNSAAYITTICGSGAGIAFGQLGANSNYIQATYEPGDAATPLVLNPYGGGVGIGTGNNAFSGQKLFIQSANDQAGITMFNSFDCNMWSLATGTYLLNNKGLAIRDEINGVTRLQFDNCGNVGIGTISPYIRLDVRGGTIGQTTTDFVASSAGTVIYMRTGATTGNTTFGLIQVGNTGDTVGGSLVLNQFGGNVGINNSFPLAALEVSQACSDQTNGGFAFKTMALADNTWTTFFTPPANWAGLTTLNWVGTNDFNRSGAAQIRWSYQPCAAQLGPTTTIFNDSQNATGYFRYSGGNMQICVDGAGAGKRLQILIQGSRGA